MQNNFEQAFSRLLASWRRHEELRSNGGSFAERLDASSELRDAQVAMARARRFL